MSKFQEYIPIYEGDRYCLMCGQACPVRRVLKNEAMSPHGWALLVASVQRGMLSWNDETVDVLYHCADCGSCQGNCATDRPLPYALMAARAETVQLGHTSAQVKAVDEKLRAWGNPFGETEDPSTPLRASSRRASEEDASVVGQPSPVTLFIGDAAHFLRPQMIEAAETLVRAAGGTSVRLRAGRSSGYLPYTLGLWDTAREFAQETVRELNDATQLVTLSTQDAHAFKHVYAELGVSMPDALNVTTLVDYLAHAEAQGKLHFRARDGAAYTYHDPTQAIRLPGHWLNTRVLASIVMGNEPREMLYRENLATPVGTSGGLEFTQPTLAEKLVRTRLQEIRETGAKIVLTDDPLDTARLEKYADGIQVLNLFEVMAEQLQ